MSEVVPVEPLPSAGDELWQQGLLLVGQWLAEASGNTRSTYADAIGWPYSASGAPRPRPARYGATWLHWCHSNGVQLFDAKRLHVLAWLEVVEAARHPLTGKPLAKRSKANMVAAVSAFYTWAMQDGHTEVNPVGLVNRKKKGLNTSKDRSPTRSLDRHETHAMLKAADNDPDESVRSRTAAIVALLWEVGLRVGELCNATLADMYVQQGKRVLHVVLKGKKDHLFALPDPVCRRIDAYLASRQDLDLLPARRGEVNASTTPLFVTNTGKPMNRMEVWRLIKRIAKLAGVDHQESMSPHVARHTFITEARRQRRASEEIKDYIGHEFVSTTDRYGKHVVNLENSPFFAVAEAFEAVGDDN